MKRFIIIFIIVLGYLYFIREIGCRIFESRWGNWNNLTEMNYPLPTKHWWGY